MTTVVHAADVYRRDAAGIFVPAAGVVHREDEYDSSQFDILLNMQQRHFWYRGRHRFLLRSLRSHARRAKLPEQLAAVDLGGGCGGWVRYLLERHPGRFGELALADSSQAALHKAADVVGERASRYQIDLLDLSWQDRWDCAFLLDVLEHIPDDLAAMQQIAASLKPGGLVFVTTPALKFFWSYNDELVHHCRRYSKADYRRLAGECGLKLIDARYFMFFLSPLLFASRVKSPDVSRMTAEEIEAHVHKTHRVPAGPINAALTAIFGLETPLGQYLPFPWGTSILAVLQKPGGEMTKAK